MKGNQVWTHSKARLTLFRRNNDKDFANWQQALIEATHTFDDIILVAHSSGGMFALATPEIEKYLIGLILLDSAPSADWQKFFVKYVEDHPLPEAEKIQKLYHEEVKQIFAEYCHRYNISNK